jgi:uncharacterized lipoprotein YmbA
MIIEKEIKMKNGLFRLWVVIIFTTLGVVLSGCASSPTPRFYLLGSLEATSPDKKPSAEEGCFSIGIGPINLPDYLDRPQIVTRGTSIELKLAEFDRWGEPLGDNLKRVLAKNLSILLCVKTIAFFPWKGGIPIDYRIEMEVLRLDGSLGGNVSLEVWWMVFSGDGKRMLVSKRSTFTEAVGGQDYKSLVGAHSRALGTLSREIAEVIKTLPK